MANLQEIQSNTNSENAKEVHDDRSAWLNKNDILGSDLDLGKGLNLKPGFGSLCGCVRDGIQLSAGGEEKRSKKKEEEPFHYFFINRMITLTKIVKITETKIELVTGK